LIDLKYTPEYIYLISTLFSVSLLLSI